MTRLALFLAITAALSLAACLWMLLPKGTGQPDDDDGDVDLPDLTWPTAEQLIEKDGAALIVNAWGRTWIHQPGATSTGADTQGVT